MTQTIAGIPAYEKYSVLIAAKTAAETTDAIEIRNHINYTFSCSTLATGEEILGEVYDVTQSAFKPWMIGGVRVKLAKDYEQIQATQTTAIVRFVKGTTASLVGLFVAHPY